MTRLERLRAAGVSIWLDALSRELLETGRFARLVQDFGVNGATSNPTIFAEAITGSDRYDEQLRTLLREGVEDPESLFLELASEDVRRAAALLRPAYEASRGRDGFVSLECTPELANDAAATVEQALELFAGLRAPNVMIKVPASAAGVVAIEELTARAVNVNVTLVFSRRRYEEVIEAYVSGLERRADAGLDISAVSSVASFFVSRLDARADARLAPGSRLRGRLAIANAGRAYAHYRSRFAGPRWEALEARGARRQRPLWASMAPKSRAYRDVLYLERLAAPDAIATVPETTLRAFADHGEVGGVLGEDARRAESVLLEAEAAGLDLDRLAAELERDGIRAFCDSYERLLGCIATKVACSPRSGEVRARRGTQPTSWEPATRTTREAE